MSAWYWLGLVLALGLFAVVVRDVRRLHRRRY